MIRAWRMRFAVFTLVVLLYPFTLWASTPGIYADWQRPGLTAPRSKSPPDGNICQDGFQPLRSEGRFSRPGSDLTIYRP